MTKELEDGFYWARRGPTWLVVEKDSDPAGNPVWHVPGVYAPVWCEWFDEIDPRPVERGATETEEALEQLLGNALIARLHMANTEEASLVASYLWDTIAVARAALAKARGET